MGTKSKILITVLISANLSFSDSKVIAAAKPKQSNAIAKISKSIPKEIERTFGIIKPDAVRTKHAGEIIRIIELNNFTILRMQKIRLTRKQAEKFYAAHKSKAFFMELINYMTSGPVILLALEKDNAVKDWRELMGATDPKRANYGTLRRMFGTNIGANAVHGSDSKSAAEQELFFFFRDLF